MDRPTAATVREWAKSGDPAAPRVNFAALGYPDTSEGTAALERMVAFAIAYVERITGRKLDESMPDELQPIAEEVVLMTTAQVIVSRSGATFTTAAGALLDGIKSFRAGDYQETRRDLTEVSKAGLINPWAALSDLLLLLATPERLEELLAQLGGQPAPAMFAVGYVADPCTYGYGPDW